MNPELPGLPRASVDTWLRATVPDLVGDSDWSAEVVSGGLSNITYRLRLASGSAILRRPPLGGVLPSAHDMTREFRVLTALRPTPVPVPQPIALCPDAEVVGYPFYLMADVTGTVLRTAADTAACTEAQRADLGQALVDTLAALHAVDVDAVGLADYGPAHGYAARQIRRWREQWTRSSTRDLPEMRQLLDALAEAIPVERETSVVHGDYRLDNTIVDLGAEPAVVRAVVDWELSTLGDPLADLGLALTYWHDAGDQERAQIPVAVGVTAQPGFPSSAEFAAAYARRTGRDLSALPFYVALGHMKLAVIMEGVHARYRGGHTVGAGYADVTDAVPALVARGLRTLRGVA
jgi:aminoglycoside phosphotransferase (APT) family kinase protein